MRSSGMDSYSLRSVSHLPQFFRSAFKFRYFNSLQSECFPTCFLSDVNMVVSAPTGSGKTVLFELCILRLLSRFLSREGKFVLVKGTLKTIYIAPSKALVQEKLRDWNQKFGSWGIICLELTGDNESYNIKTIQEADIILTTPEKFDAVTRYRIKDGGLGFFSDVALLVIDEVHLLNDPRGAALEAIVSRIKMLAQRSELKSSPISHVRFIAVSATIPNVEDLAQWLMVPPQGVKRFGEEMRPVKLTTKVFGYAAAKNDFLFEKRLQNYIFDVLMQFSRGKSALVFCSTRKGAQEAAHTIAQTAMSYGPSNPFIRTREQQERLREASFSCSDKHMQSYVPHGVGYHNGGLCMKDRNLIERLFLNGDVQVLCATNTLAHGINLPAHTVVIKSTQQYNKEKSQYMEYDRSTILQMCGRAGRPPFDDTGLVIIMTRKETVHLYENLLGGCETVESQFLSCMTEHLTAEIVQSTVSDIAQAIEWVKCSYLYVRMKKNPTSYGVNKGISNDRVEKHTQEVCVQRINDLSKYQMIYTDEDGFLLKSLEPGRLMTKYYLKFDTMKYIMQTKQDGNMEDILRTVCRAEELSWIQLRRNEKKLLNDINTDKDGRLRFHVLGDKAKRKKRIQTREEKIFVLTNDYLTGDPVAHDLSLMQDANSICSNGCRVAKCMKEYFIYKRNFKGALNSGLLAKSLHQKLWDGSPYLLKQLSGIGMVTAKALNSTGINSFETLSDADPRRIELVTGRKYPFGNHIKESLNALPPKVGIRMEAVEGRKPALPKLAVTLIRQSESRLTKRHFADMIVGIEEENLIIYHEKIRVNEFSSPYSTTITLPKLQYGNGTVRACLIFEEYLGIDLQQTLAIGNENCSHATLKDGNKRPLPLPRPVDSKNLEGGDESESHPLIEKPNIADTLIPILGPEPSFNLLDEDLEKEIQFAEEVEAKYERKHLNKNTIFDHIRKKAKEFPALASATESIHSPPSLEALKKIPRKRVRATPDEPHDVGENTDDKEGSNKKQDQKITSLASEFKKGERVRQLTRANPDETSVISRSLDIVNLLNHKDTLNEVAGSFPPCLEDNITKTEEKGTIFDHIRRKSKNFPTIPGLGKNENRQFFGENWNPLDDYIDLSHSPLGTVKDYFCSTKNPPDTVIILDSEPSDSENEDWKQRFACSDAGAKPDCSLKLTSSEIGEPSNKEQQDFHLIPSVTVKENLIEQQREKDSDQDHGSQNQQSSESQSCSKAVVDSMTDDPFLGFKSIFSFL